MFDKLLKKWLSFIKPFFKKEEHRAFRAFFKNKIPSLKQLKYLGRILDKQEKKTVKILSAVILTCLIVLILRIYFSITTPIPTVGGKYVEGIVGTTKFINPLLAIDDADRSISQLIYSGLLKYDENLALQPDLASEFFFDQEQKKYTFCLKENLFWHDGVKITADDVIFTLTLIKNPVLKNQFLEKLRDVEVEKVNENCLKIKTKNLSNLTVGILPKHIWESIQPEEIAQSKLNLRPIGSGPFKFDSLIKDSDNQIKIFNLEQNKNYYQKTYIKEIAFKFYPDTESAMTALKEKEIDGLGYISKKLSKQALSEIKNLKYYQLNLPYYTAIFFNLRSPKDINKTNFLKDKSVRLALSYLTPKQEILEQVFNQEGVIIDGPILPNSPFFNQGIKKYEYNSALAAQTLNQNGWTKNTDGFFEKDKKTLEISLTTVDQPDFLEAASIIQKSWENIGLKIKLIVVSSCQIKEIIKNRQFETFLYGILENLNFDPYPIWHSSQIESPGLNLSGFSYRRTDEILEKASLSENEQERKNYYLEFQNIINDNLPAVFLCNTTYSYLINEKIKGLDTVNLIHPADRFNKLQNWYIKTKRQFNKNNNK